jgi:hypothetical protein
MPASREFQWSLPPGGENSAERFNCAPSTSGVLADVNGDNRRSVANSAAFISPTGRIYERQTLWTASAFHFIGIGIVFGRMDAA